MIDNLAYAVSLSFDIHLIRPHLDKSSGIRPGISMSS